MIFPNISALIMCFCSLDVNIHIAWTVKNIYNKKTCRLKKENNIYCKHAVEDMNNSFLSLEQWL